MIHQDIGLPGGHGSVFHHMGGKDLAIFVPFRAVDMALAVDAIRRAISHGKGVVRVVMGKQALPSKYQQPVQIREPLIDRIKPRLIAHVVNRIGMAQPPGFAAAHRNGDRQAQLAQPFGEFLPSSSSDMDHHFSSGSQGSSAHSTVTPFGAPLAL